MSLADTFPLYQSLWAYVMLVGSICILSMAFSLVAIFATGTELA